MDNRYRLILSNNNFYREVQLPQSASQYRVGTTYESDCRFAKERFFTEFELLLNNDGTNWIVSCRKGDIYFQDKGTMKLKSYKLSHGTELQVLYQYQGSDQILFKLSFILDFEAEKANYERVLDVGGMQIVTFGRERNCDIILDDQLLGHDTVKLERKGGELYIVDCGTRYGVYVNGVKIQGEEQIRDYDFFSILGFSFYYKEGELYTSKHSRLFPGSVPAREISDQNNHLSYPQFNRNTQVKITVPEEEITILDPPAKPEKPKQNIVMTLLPSLAMIALVVVMRGMMGGGNMTFVLYSAASMTLGVITTIVGFVNSKKEYKENTEKREEEYNAYLASKRKEIRAARELEKELLQKKYISPEQEIINADEFDQGLFDRTPKDDDFLTLRLGTGNLPAKRKVSYKAKEAISVADPLAMQPQALETEFCRIDGVPVQLPLKAVNAVGITGDDSQLYEFVKQSIVDLCTRQYYDDMRLFLISERPLDEFAWVRWLPHVDNPAIGARNIASTAEERTVLLEYLYSELMSRSQSKCAHPRFVVIVYLYTAFKNHPISKFIDAAERLGITFVFVENYAEMTPLYCKWLIQLSERKGEGRLIDSSGEAESQDFYFRSLSDSDAERIAVKLAPVYCEEINLEAALTKSITFFEMMGIFTVDDLDLQKNWASAQIYKTMAAPMGVKTQDKLVYLDLHERAHGPHGLVAGTTGSGKSEALQTYILSMAITYHPYEVGFVIIDFKGGGMADQFKDLPHLIGTITNIDGREIDRSLKSIKAELQKRQRVFREAEVNNIGDYIRKYKSGEVKLPLPHLIIVVDEFAELKAEQPEFMAELISAARIGRSLGVHLILATQKPSGQVNEQIWSNSRFKLCLKVQTPEDSNEVLKSPLAAEIREPGRAYLQVGNNEIFELFQSAYSGAPATVSDMGTQKEYVISKVSLSGARTTVYQKKKKKATNESAQSQLKAIVEYVSAFCANKSIDKLSPICLPPLPSLLPYQDDCVRRGSDYVVQMGVFDDPDSQYQGPAELSMIEDNLLIIGASQMGKTNLVQLIIRQLANAYSPEELAIYICDFGSGALSIFKDKSRHDLNHIGGVVSANEGEKLKNLFKLLTEEIEARKEKLVDAGLSSFRSYCEAGYSDLPLILFCIDNFSVFKELYGEDYEGTLLYIVREGLTYGISVVITNQQTAGLGFRYMSNIGRRIAFTCNDRGEYSSILDRCRIEPKNIAGRALFEKDKTIFEFQSFLSFTGEKEYERIKQVETFATAVNEKYSGLYAKKIPSIPEQVSSAYIRANYPEINVAENISIGLDYSTVDCVSLNIFEQFVLAVAGKNADCRQQFIRAFLKDIHTNIFKRQVKLYAIDNYRRELEAYKDLPYMERYSTSADSITEIIEDIHEELSERFEMLEDEGVEALNRMEWIVVFVNNKQAFDALVASRSSENKFAEIYKKFSALKILFMLTDVNDSSIPSSTSQLLRRIREDKKLLYFGASKEMKILDLYASTVRSIGALTARDDAYYLEGETVIRMKTIQEE